MKPILILRIPQDAVESIPELRKAIARSFRQYKTSVIFDDAKQKGFKISVINPSKTTDELIEKHIAEIIPNLNLFKYMTPNKDWENASISLSSLVYKVLKARLKNFFYFGKWVN
jgi:hypothetical protein